MCLILSIKKIIRAFVAIIKTAFNFIADKILVPYQRIGSIKFCVFGYSNKTIKFTKQKLPSISVSFSQQ